MCLSVDVHAQVCPWVRERKRERAKERERERDRMHCNVLIALILQAMQL